MLTRAEAEELMALHERVGELEYDFLCAPSKNEAVAHTALCAARIAFEQRLSSLTEKE